MMSNILYVFHSCKKEAFVCSILPSANISLISRPKAGFFRGLKYVSQFSGKHFTYTKVFLGVFNRCKTLLSRCPRIESKGPPSEQKTKALELYKPARWRAEYDACLTDNYSMN